MRLWTLHPKQLDARGLVALWREGLLARKVLSGATLGYRHHPQLARFRAQAEPLSAIDAYLVEVWREADRRGYAFDGTKIGPGFFGARMSAPSESGRRTRDRRTNERKRSGIVSPRIRIAETKGQVAWEWQHLLEKLRVRDAAAFAAAARERTPTVHPLFRVVAGGIRAWERGAAVALTGSRAAPSRRRRAATASPRGS